MIEYLISEKDKGIILVNWHIEKETRSLLPHEDGYVSGVDSKTLSGKSEIYLTMVDPSKNP